MSKVKIKPCSCGVLRKDVRKFLWETLRRSLGSLMETGTW